VSKTIITLILPPPKVRRKTAKAVQYHKDKSRYCRKAKHKGPLIDSGGPFLLGALAGRVIRKERGEISTDKIVIRI
jgi:hypothetical protein